MYAKKQLYKKYGTKLFKNGENCVFLVVIVCEIQTFKIERVTSYRHELTNATIIEAGDSF
jgi:hypothetical protein